MAGKIRISWDDVNSSAVDEKLKDRDAVARAQQHFGEGAAAAGGFRWTSLFYNTLVYMTLFGLIGGAAGWFIGEVVQLCFASPWDEFEYYALERAELDELAASGAISDIESRQRLQRINDRYSRNPYVAALMQRESLSDDVFKERWQRADDKSGVLSFLDNLVWVGMLGIVLSFFLSVADQCMSMNLRGVVVSGSVGITCGLVGGVMVSMFINQLYNALGGGVEGTPLFQQILARAIGWGVLGGFLAVAPGLVLKNWKRLLIGVAGGLIGGTLGGMLFDPIGRIVAIEGVSRLCGVVAIGLLTGLGTGVIESVAKTGWLQVVAGLIAGKQFILYKSPTYVGSSPQCEIYLFKDPNIGPRHAAIHRIGGGYDIEDLQSATGTLVNGRPIKRQRLKKGDRVQIGDTVFLFQERGR